MHEHIEATRHHVICLDGYSVGNLQLVYAREDNNSLHATRLGAVSSHVHTQVFPPPIRKGVA